mmetsp:Transcript_65916/g.136463  ORF Transcript_65916/g.136463 Transcript_65916/m.136463 type:complete len:88 (+) Transcript_65916:875-1138(+)
MGSCKDAKSKMPQVRWGLPEVSPKSWAFSSESSSVSISSAASDLSAVTSCGYKVTQETCLYIILREANFNLATQLHSLQCQWKTAGF